MNLTKNYTTQTPYTKGVQQPQNQNFATAPHVILNSFQNLITRPPYSSQPHKDVFVKTAQPSFGTAAAITPPISIPGLDKFREVLKGLIMRIERKTPDQWREVDKKPSTQGKGPKPNKDKPDGNDNK